MYYLVCKLDPKDHAKFLKEPFETEEEAVARAHVLLTSGEAFACVLEDDSGTVADDAEVAKRCTSL
jgi:hypothetical protein